MTNVKRKNLAAIIVMFLLIGLFLIKHYSTYGVITFATLIIYLLVRTIGMSKPYEYGIIENLGDYIGAGLFSILLIYAFQYPLLYKYSSKQTATIGWLIFYFIVMVIVLIIGKEGRTITSIVVKYAILYVMTLFMYFGVEESSYSVSYKETDKTVYTTLLLITLFFALSELIAKRYSTNKGQKGICWLFAISLLFMLLQMLCPVVAPHVIYALGHLKELRVWSWPIIVITIVAMGCLSVYCRMVDDKDKEKQVDSKTVLMILLHILAMEFGIVYNSKYVVLFFLALYVVDYIGFFGKDAVSGKNINIFKWEINKSNLGYLLMALATVLIYITGFYGTADIVIVIMASTLSVFFLYEKEKKDLKLSFWLYLLLTIALTGADLCYHWHNSKQNYIYILALFLVAMFTVLITELKNELLNEKHNYMKVIIVVIFAILVLFTGKSYGVDAGIKVVDAVNAEDTVIDESQVETQNISIKFKTSGKKNQISKLYCYWNGNKDSVMQLKPDESGKVIIPKSIGTLSIYAEDKYGVSSRYTRVFY